MKKHAFAFVVILVLVGSSLTVLVDAQQEFTVPPESAKTVTINLNKGEFVNGSFSVTGGTGTGVDFCVSNPNGKELINCNFTSSKSFSFPALTAGTYRLSFDNSFCSCVGGKNVTLEYSITQPASNSTQASSYEGLPIIEVLVLVVAIVAVTAVVILMKRSTKANNTKGMT